MSKAAIVDADKTITRHPVANSIGMIAYKEAEGWRKAYALIKGMEVIAGTPVLGEDWGLKTFVQALVKVGTSEEKMRYYGQKALDKHLRYGAIENLNNISKDHDLYIITTGCDIGPKLLKEVYGVNMTDYYANSLVYENSMLTDCDVKIDENNIRDFAEAIALSYDDSIIIDDRPDRYVEKYSEVYGSIDAFMAEREMGKA